MLKSKLSLSRHFEYANKQITYHFWLCSLEFLFFLLLRCSLCWPFITMFTLLTFYYDIYPVDLLLRCSPCWPFITIFTLLTFYYDVHPVDLLLRCSPCWPFITMLTLLTFYYDIHPVDLLHARGNICMTVSFH